VLFRKKEKRKLRLMIQVGITATNDIFNDRFSLSVLHMFPVKREVLHMLHTLFIIIALKLYLAF
jgi:hypothetical protein